MNFPDNLKYTKDHEWIKVDGNIATIGITDFAQGELGDIVYVEIETVGKDLARESVFGTVEAVNLGGGGLRPSPAAPGQARPPLPVRGRRQCRHWRCFAGPVGH